MSSDEARSSEQSFTSFFKVCFFTNLQIVLCSGDLLVSKVLLDHVDVLGLLVHDGCTTTPEVMALYFQILFIKKISQSFNPHVYRFRTFF